MDEAVELSRLWPRHRGCLFTRPLSKKSWLRGLAVICFCYLRQPRFRNQCTRLVLVGL
jgi:hypothetical protein